MKWIKSGMTNNTGRNALLLNNHRTKRRNQGFEASAVRRYTATPLHLRCFGYSTHPEMDGIIFIKQLGTEAENACIHKERAPATLTKH